MYRSGQVIKANVNSMPLVDHYGIILVEGNETYVIHNTPFRNAVIDRIDDFLDSRTLVSLQNTYLEYNSNDSIINRFEKQCKRSYGLFEYNCEHFIGCMLNQSETSPQLQSWAFKLIASYCIKKFIF